MSTRAPEDLLGHWRLDRVIEDARAAEVLRVHGSATLELLEPGRVRWHEQGLLARGTASPVEVTRTLYVVRRAPEGHEGHEGHEGPESPESTADGPGGWEVTFEDGRPFHPWRTGEPLGHPCGPDHYEGLIETGPETDTDTDTETWTVTWHCRGPAKDYLSRTRHTRADPGPT